MNLVRVLEPTNTVAELAHWLAEKIREDGPLSSVFQTLESALPNHSVVVKGGWVRDVLLGRKPNDVDLEVRGDSFDVLKEKLSTAFGGDVFHQGRRAPILVIRIAGAPELQVSVREKQGAPIVSDFTSNALRLDPFSPSLEDPFDGLRDLRSRTLRLVPDVDLKTTPSIFFRAITMAGRLPEFEIEGESILELRKVVGERWDFDVPADYKAMQIRKWLVESERPSCGLRLLRDTEWLARESPELHKLWNTPQDPLHHPEGDVGIHTEMVLDQAAALMRQPGRDLSDEDKTVLMLSALLHDIGKPSTTQTHLVPPPRGIKITSYDHENVGVPLANQFMKRVGFGMRVRKQVKAFVAAHMLPSRLHRDFTHGGITEHRFDNEVRKIVRRIAPASFKALLTFTEADFRGRGKVDSESAYAVSETFAESVHRNGFDLDPKARLLKHSDLLELGIHADTAEILQTIEARRDAGKLRTRDQAVQFVRHNYLLTDNDLADAGITDGKQRGRVYIALKQAIAKGDVENRGDAIDHLRKFLATQCDPPTD